MKAVEVKEKVGVDGGEGFHRLLRLPVFFLAFVQRQPNQVLQFVDALIGN